MKSTIWGASAGGREGEGGVQWPMLIEERNLNVLCKISKLEKKKI